MENIEYLIPDFKELLYKRIGLNNSKKEIIKPISIIYPNLNYKFNNNLNITNDKINYFVNKIKPNITVIEGEWNNKKIIKSISYDNLNKRFSFDENEDIFGFLDLKEDEYVDDNKNSFNNILGDYNLFNCSNSNYYFIPQEATSELLSYYNCKLINLNDNFSFEIEENLLHASMDISFNYVEDYLLQDNYGGGIFIEYHNLPHFYYPVDEYSQGYIILGKKKKENSYNFSAFKIPYNSGIYIPPDVIHSDCYLTGEYNICFGKSKKYSSAILKNCSELVKFNFL